MRYSKWLIKVCRFWLLSLCLLTLWVGLASANVSVSYSGEILSLSLRALHTESLSDDLASQVTKAESLMQQRRFVEASSAWRTIHAHTGDNRQLALNALLANAFAAYYSGEIKVAQNASELIFKKLSKQQTPNNVDMVGAHYLAAMLDSLHFNLDSALKHYSFAQRWLNSVAPSQLEVARRDALFSKINLARAEILFQLERIADARKELIRARKWARQANDHSTLMATRTAMIALAMREHGQAHLAAQLAAVANEFNERDQFNDIDAETLIRFADVLSQIPPGQWWHIGKTITALNGALQALIASPVLPTQLRSQAMALQAHFYQQLARPDDADLLLQNAIRLAQQTGDKLLLMRALADYGDLQNRQGNYQTSLRAFRMAVSHLNAFKNDTSILAQSGLYHSEYYYNDIYLGLVDLLLRESSLQKDDEIQQTLLREAQSVLEKKKNIDLQNYFHDQCITNFKKNVRPLDDVAKPDTAIFYPIVLPDRLELLLSHSGKLKRFVSNVSRGQLQEEVISLRKQLLNVNARDYLEPARRLYDWIIRPIDAALSEEKIANLVVVSEALLRTVPFAVFNDGEHFLVQKYALALSPGLSLTDPKKIDRSNLQILLGGLSESVQGFPALNYVKGELEEIQDLYANELLLNRDFVIKRFSEALSNPQFSVAHVASHSEMSFDSQKSYILAFDGKISMDQLGQMTSLQRRHKPIELLTLSACQTAAGDDRAALGLAGVAVKSGARSALATLWAIDDLASSLLVSEFYKQLSNAKLSKAQALRNAQIALIRSHRFGHPAYWSSFLLIGNWL